GRVQGNDATCLLPNFTVSANPAPVQAVDAFSVRVFPEANASGRPGQTVSFEVAIVNNQNEDGFARLKVVSPFEKSTTFDYVDVDVPAHGQKTVTAKVSIPAGTPRDTYEALFVVEAFEGSGCCSHSFAVRRQLFVFSDLLRLSLSSEPASCLIARHNEQINYTFTLRNDGEVDGPFDFELLGTQAALAATHLDTQTLQIDPGDQQRLSWRVAPPQGTVLDKYDLVLRARYQDFTVFEKPLCFIVDAQRNFTVFANETYDLVRGEPAEVAFRVLNTGTISRAFTIDAQAPANVEYRVLEPAFTLTPNEAKVVHIAVSSTLLATLGDHPLGVTVSDGRIRKSVDAYLVFSSSSKPGKSFLDLEPGTPSVFSGVPQEERVAVTNKHAITQTNVRIAVEGLPTGWYLVRNESQNIVPGKTASFHILFSVPANEPAGQHQYAVTAQSEQGEKTRVQTVLDVRAAPAHLDVAVTNVQNQDGQVSFTVLVYNNGLKPLPGVIVTAGAFTQNVNDLAPGEQRTATFTGLASGPLVVSARSADGVQSAAVTVPIDAAPQGQVNAILLALVILMLVLVAVAFLLRKEHLDEVARQHTA
ncbi:MAG: NEW3 domain-containing protein, partial [Candidatus Micrarchaeota archaeon]|nr:NEW3 domain-containing protein [Candidatus Micrarchaeota archaeon]